MKPLLNTQIEYLVSDLINPNEKSAKKKNIKYIKKNKHMLSSLFFSIEGWSNNGII